MKKKYWIKNQINRLLEKINDYDIEEIKQNNDKKINFDNCDASYVGMTPFDKGLLKLGLLKVPIFGVILLKKDIVSSQLGKTLLGMSAASMIVVPCIKKLINEYQDRKNFEKRQENLDKLKKILN